MWFYIINKTWVQRKDKWVCVSVSIRKHCDIRLQALEVHKGLDRNCYCCLVTRSRVQVSNSFSTSWTVALQAPLSMGLPRQEFWSGLPFPSPGNNRTHISCIAGGFFTAEPPVMPRKKLGRDIMWGKWQKFCGEDTGFTWKTKLYGTSIRWCLKLKPHSHAPSVWILALRLPN